MDKYKFVTVPGGLEKDKHDFFEYNPELRFFPAVDRLFEEVGPQVASNIMWAVYLAEDPDSKFYTQRPELRRRYTEQGFLRIEGFDWDRYKYLIDAYPEMSMSTSKRDFYRLRRKYDSLLDEVEGLGINDALPFYKALKVIYEGLELAESKWMKEKSMTVKDGSSKNAPGAALRG